MMFPVKVNRSTIAAQSRGSVKVLVQPENDSSDAIATEAVSSRSVRTWNSGSAPRRSSSRSLSLRGIAAVLDLAPSTVSREVAGTRAGVSCRFA
jgi:hypothetical protein